MVGRFAKEHRSFILECLDRWQEASDEYAHGKEKQASSCVGQRLDIIVVQGWCGIPVERNLKQGQEYRAEESDDHNCRLSLSKNIAAPHEARQLDPKRGNHVAYFFFLEWGAFELITFFLDFLFLLFCVATVEQQQLGFVLFGFRVCYCKDSHKDICGVGHTGKFEPDVGEVISSQLSKSLVHNFAVRHKN